jgi:hypothetical protein
MKQALFFILITVTSFSFGQGNNDNTLDFFISSANEMTFNLVLNEPDSIILSKGFDFEKFTPNNFIHSNGFFKTHYMNQKIILVEFYSDSILSKLEYQCYVNDFDSLKYFIFLRPISTDTLISSHSIGVNISANNLSLIIATHRFFNKDTIVKNNSNFAINYPAPEQSEKETKYSYDTNYKITWISDSYYSGRSIFIIDSNLMPLHRFYFNSDFLIYFTNCEINNDTCSEYIFSYNPRIEQNFKGKFLTNTIDIELLLRVKQINSMWPTFIIKYFYPLENYYFNWEYYKFYIGKPSYRTKN